jgi:hypothetical protein
VDYSSCWVENPSCADERVRSADVSDMAEACPVLFKIDLEIIKIKDSHRTPSKRSEIPQGLQ